MDRFQLFFILIATNMIQFVIAGDDLCETLESEVGRCIKITDCKMIYEVVSTIPLPITDSFVEYLRLSHCGFNGTVPKVCCPHTLYDKSYSKDLAGHKNSYLLKNKFCGVSQEPRILGGTVTHVNEFPWMALLIYDLTISSYKCGGSLISDRYVLTAAHCIKDRPKRVRLGEHTISSIIDCELFRDKYYCAPPYQEYHIERTIQHERYYNHTYANDIALIRLSRRIEREANVMPVCLPLYKNIRDIPLDGMNLTVIGWGFDDTSQSDVLLKVRVMVIGKKECEDKYKIDGYKIGIMANKLCAGGTVGQDSCQGDSGGPLMYPGVYQGALRYVQHGIVSYGGVSCGSHIPSAYTRVSKYMEWILDHLEA